MTKEFVGINGKLVPAEQATVSVMDHGFLYGVVFFATMRYENGRVFLWHWHVERLHQACNSLQIQWTPGESDDGSDLLLRQVHEVCQANGLNEAYVRVSVSAGEAPLGIHTGAYAAPKTIILAKPLPMNIRMGARAPKRLHKLETLRTTTESQPRYKSSHYLNNIYGRRELFQVLGTQDGEGLFLDPKGAICEGLVTNVFFRKGSVWFTPDESTGCLPGVTRRWVIQWLKAMQIQVVEGRFTWEQLTAADEAFLCNALQEIVPVRALSDHQHMVKSWDEYMWTSAAQKDHMPSSMMIAQAYVAAKKQSAGMDLF
jgi:4-amino-4-deoxychorismate lyase